MEVTCPLLICEYFTIIKPHRAKERLEIVNKKIFARTVRLVYYIEYFPD